jgi:hypothetical protein
MVGTAIVSLVALTDVRAFDPQAYLVAVADTAEKLSKIAEVVRLLNTARSDVIELDNGTDKPLQLVTSSHDHGGFAATPRQTIPPQTAMIFGSQSKGGSAFTGTQGKVVYSGDEFQLTCSWNNPFWGSNSARIEITGPKAGFYKATSIAGVGERDAQVRCEVFPFPVGQPVVSDGSMMREVSYPHVYVIYGGAKFHLPTSDWVEKKGGWNAVKVVPDRALDQLPATPGDGTLLREQSSAAVYVMGGGTKRWIRSPDRFNQLNYDWNNIREVPDGALVGIPDGAQA